LKARNGQLMVKGNQPFSSVWPWPDPAPAALKKFIFRYRVVTRQSQNGNFSYSPDSTGPQPFAFPNALIAAAAGEDARAAGRVAAANFAVAVQDKYKPAAAAGAGDDAKKAVPVESEGWFVRVQRLDVDFDLAHRSAVVDMSWDDKDHPSITLPTNAEKDSNAMVTVRAIRWGRVDVLGELLYNPTPKKDEPAPDAAANADAGGAGPAPVAGRPIEGVVGGPPLPGAAPQRRYDDDWF